MTLRSGCRPQPTCTAGTQQHGCRSRHAGASASTAEADKLGSVLSGCEDDDLGNLPKAETVPAEAAPETAAAEDDAESGDEGENEEASEEKAEAEPEPADDCHPAYEPCLPNQPGDALNSGDPTKDQKPVRIKEIGADPYKLDRDQDGWGCTS